MATKDKKGAVPKAQGIRYRVRKDGTVRGYEVRYRDPEDNSKVRGKTFRTLDEAKAFQRDNGYRIQQGSYIAPEREATTWKQVSEEWLAGHRVRIKPRTLNGYECMLGRWHTRWDQRPIGSISRKDVRDLITDVRAKGRTEETEHRIFNVANAALDYAVQEGYIRTNPAAAVRKELRSVRRKEFKARALTEAEAEAILAYLPAGRFHLFGLLAFWTACRAGELAGLRVRNVDRLRNLVQVDETVQDLNGVLSVGTTKTDGSKGRRLLIPPPIMKAVGAFIDKQRLQPEDYLFAGPNEFFHYQNFRNRQWLPALKAAGFMDEDDKPLVRFHDLRHTRLTIMAPHVRPHVLKEFAGHSNITTTFNFYVHADPEDPHLEAAISRLYSDRQDNLTTALFDAAEA